MCCLRSRCWCRWWSLPMLSLRCVWNACFFLSKFSKMAELSHLETLFLFWTTCKMPFSCLMQCSFDHKTYIYLGILLNSWIIWSTNGCVNINVSIITDATLNIIAQKLWNKDLLFLIFLEKRIVSRNQTNSKNCCFQIISMINYISSIYQVLGTVQCKILWIKDELDQRTIDELVRYSVKWKNNELVGR